MTPENLHRNGPKEVHVPGSSDDERTTTVGVVRVSGTILFVATLSPSFTLFTLDSASSDVLLLDGQEDDAHLEADAPESIPGSVLAIHQHPRPPPPQKLQHRLDVVIKQTNKAAAPYYSSEQEGGMRRNPTHRGTTTVETVQRCAAQRIPITVYGRQKEPWQICTCRPHCPHVILHCEDSVVLLVQDKVDAVRNQMEVHDDSREPVAEENDADDAAVSVTDDDVVQAELEEYCQIRSVASAEISTDETDCEPAKANGPYSETASSAPLHRRRRRTKVRNASRSSRFVDALLLERVVRTTMGAHNDSTSSDNNNIAQTVLDVAGGGSGAGIAMELSMRRRIPTTVIDPRPVQWNGARRRTLQFRHDARQTLAPGLSISHQAQVLYKRFQPWTVSQMPILFEDTLEFTRQHDHLLRHCTAIVGLHPDQATEAIVQVALRYQKPWAVVPCCVFPKTFVDRRFFRHSVDDDNNNDNNTITAATKPVRTYEELCTYLHTLVPGVQERTLDFEGRNKMYFWIPPSHLSSSTIHEAGDTVGLPGNIQSDEWAHAAEI